MNRPTRRPIDRRRLLALLPAGALAACAAPFAGPPPPRVSIIDLRPLDATMFEQRWEALLRVEEQAGTGLQVDAMTAAIEMNGREFGKRPHLPALPAAGPRRTRGDGADARLGPRPGRPSWPRSAAAAS